MTVTCTTNHRGSSWLPHVPLTTEDPHDCHMYHSSWRILMTATCTTEDPHDCHMYHSPQRILMTVTCTTHHRGSSWLSHVPLTTEDPHDCHAYHSPQRILMTVTCTTHHRGSSWLSHVPLTTEDPHNCLLLAATERTEPKHTQSIVYFRWSLWKIITMQIDLLSELFCIFNFFLNYCLRMIRHRTDRNMVD